MRQPEIILNLWYVHDDMGFIYSLRARAYLGFGDDQENLTLLQKFAIHDYLIARPFPIPERFGIQGKPLFHKSAMDQLDSPIALFEDAIRALNRELPSQTPFEIPKRPLVCITPLLGDDAGNIQPHFSGKDIFPDRS